jgi:hypothetical protein
MALMVTTDTSSYICYALKSYSLDDFLNYGTSTIQKNGIPLFLLDLYLTKINSCPGLGFFHTQSSMSDKVLELIECYLYSTKLNQVFKGSFWIKWYQSRLTVGF